MKKRLTICILFAASALLFNGCKASEKPATAEKAKKQAEQPEKNYSSNIVLSVIPTGRMLLIPRKHYSSMPLSQTMSELLKISLT
ncbi:MAG: hypothetical protein HY808_11200 [Nitrospirae bacterium]|nr:hypothetical protein [Nitrospirota bacterium]